MNPGAILEQKSKITYYNIVKQLKILFENKYICLQTSCANWSYFMLVNYF